MSSRCRRPELPALLLASALALSACEREEREARGQPLPESSPASTVTTTLYAGEPAPPPPDPRRAEYEGNAFHIAEGQRLFTWYNCSGCHAHGGGDIGPPLIDGAWRYGGELEQIYASIVQGRPNGMPSFRGKVTEQQLWQLSAYVRAMSGHVPKDAAPSRPDHMSSAPPPIRMEPQPMGSGDRTGGAQGTEP